jgi:hypothetical protein
MLKELISAVVVAELNALNSPKDIVSSLCVSKYN